jgi:3-dehydroquinate synthase
MVMAMELSRRLGLVDAAYVQRVATLIEKAGLPVLAPCLSTTDNAARYLELMQIDKKSQDGEIRFVVIDGAARAIVRAAPEAIVREVIDACCLRL